MDTFHTVNALSYLTTYVLLITLAWAGAALCARGERKIGGFLLLGSSLTMVSALATEMGLGYSPTLMGSAPMAIGALGKIILVIGVVWLIRKHTSARA